MKLNRWAIVTLAGILLLQNQASYSQGYENYFVEQSLLFSRQNSGGSARIQAMGGAQVALGGDFSSASSNPAGLGFYNRNEFTITPALTLQNSNGSYRAYGFDDQNNPTTDVYGSSSSSSNLSLPGLSIVFGSGKTTDQPFYGGTFAITLNRINDFNGSIEYSGRNRGTSIVSYFLENASGYVKEQFDPAYNFDPTYPNNLYKGPISEGKGDNVNTSTFLGYENYLFGQRTANGKDYFTDLRGGKPLQAETNKLTGSQNQWNISYGANFLDKVFLGASLGIISVRYQYDKTYSEDFSGQTIGEIPPNQTIQRCQSCFKNLKLKETRTTSGSGVNLTVGALVKPIDYFQFGLSYTTSSAYQLTDSYKGTMTTSWNNYDYYGLKNLNDVSSSTIDDPVNYGLSTPGRFKIGTAFFIPKKGFITAEIEMVNYGNASTSNFSDQLYSLTIDANANVNRVVSSRFKSVTNLRVGGEYRLKNFRFRAGYNAMENPYSRQPFDRVNYSLTELSSVTGGFGYRTAKFFVDLAVVQTQGNGYYLPYTVSSNFSDAPPPDYKYVNSITKIMFTVGIPF
jgi:hypothetical protein